jgi:deoxycytidylate deaminase
MKMKFFKLAKVLSEKSSYCHKLGAVVVKKNKVIGTGYNKPNKTHPKSNNSFKTVHAELDAILKVNAEELNGATIYVYRETKDGLPANAKCCKYCRELLKMVGIKKICYTSDKSFKEEIV